MMSDETFDPAAELSQLRASRAHAGAVASGSYNPAAELASLRTAHNQKATDAFLAGNEDFRSALDNPGEVPPGVRAIASLPISAAGKLGYLQSRYPEGVKSAPGGKVIVRQAGKWMELNKPGLDWGDVAGMLGPAIEAVPAGIAKTAPGAFAVGAGANLVRQGAAAALAGESIPDNRPPQPNVVKPGMPSGPYGLPVEQNTRELSPRAGAAMNAGLANAAGAALVGGVSAGLQALTPTARVSRIVQGGVKEVGKEAERSLAKVGTPAENIALHEQFDMPYSAADVTQSKEVAIQEALLRNSPKGAQTFNTLADKKVAALQSMKKNLVNELSGGEAKDPTTAAENLIKSRKYEDDALWEARKVHADVKFKAIDDAAGGQPVLTAPNFAEALRADIAATSGPGMPGTQKSTHLAGILKSLYDKDGNLIPMTGSHYQNLLHEWGSGISGQPHDLDPSYASNLSKHMYSVLQKDLDSAAESTGVGSKVTSALRDARDTYAGDSRAIEAVRGEGKDGSPTVNPLLQEIIKRGGLNDPEKIIDGLASGNKSPTQVRAMYKVVESFDPNTARDLKAATLGEMMSPRRIGADTVDNTLASLNDAKNWRTIAAMYGDKPDVMKKLSDLKDLLTMQHKADVLRGSPTAHLETGKSFLESFPVIGEFAQKAGEISGLSKQFLHNSKTTARLLSTPEGIDVALGIAKADSLYGSTRKMSQKAAQDVARLGFRAAQLTATSTDPEVNTP